jgi:type I restriction enzyme, S subunit
MPQHWKTYKLGEFATFQRGFDLPSQNRCEGTIPIIAASGITGYHNQYKVKGPGVVTGRSGTIGQVMFSEIDFWPLNTSLWVKDFHENDPKFVYYFFKNFDFGGLNSGTSVPTLNRNDLHELEVTIPPLPEQRAIASILSALDDKIELNLQMNKTLEEMAMALYKHWFVDFGPFKDGKFVESELGLIPEGWEVKKFFDLFELLSGGTPKTTVDEYWNGDICWVSAKDIGNGGIFIDSTEKQITQLGIEKSATKMLPENTVIVVARGSVGKFGMIAKPMTMNQSCYGIFSKSTYSQPLAYLLTSSLISHFQSVAYGSVFDTITTSTFQNINVLLPNNKSMELIRKQIEPLFDKIKQNTLENSVLKEKRDSLLPKLISGDLKINF